MGVAAHPALPAPLAVQTRRHDHDTLAPGMVVHLVLPASPAGRGKYLPVIEMVCLLTAQRIPHGSAFHSLLGPESSNPRQCPLWGKGHGEGYPSGPLDASADHHVSDRAQPHAAVHGSTLIDLNQAWRYVQMCWWTQSVIY